MSDSWSIETLASRRAPWLGRQLQRMGRLNHAVLRRAYPDLSNVSVRWPEERRVDVGPVRLQTLRWSGKRSALLCLHGINANAWSWARMASQFAQEREIISLSLRGHGTSSRPEQGYALEDTTRDLIAFLDKEGLESVHLAGESWGGKVAMHAAATHPERFRSLILVDPVRPWGFNPLLHTFPGFVLAAFDQERQSFPDEQSLYNAMDRVVYLPLGDELDRRSWRERFHCTSDGRFVPCLPDRGQAEILSQVLAADIRAQVAGCSVPVLRLQPTVSIAFWPGEDRQWPLLFPRHRVKKVWGDHTVVCLHPQAVAEEITRFLDSLGQD